MGFYDFGAHRLSEARLNPQLKHMGVIEFLIDDLVPGGKDTLLMGISGFRMPEPRKVQPIPVKYLNGVVKYPGGPAELGDLSVTFNDYVDGQQRRVLHQWFDYVYDERTGISGLKSDVAVDAYIILFGPNGNESTQYYLYNIWPTGDPNYGEIEYNDSGSIMQMEVTFAVDYVIDEVVNGANFGNSLGTQAQTFASAARVSAGAAIQGFGGSISARSGFNI